MAIELRRMPIYVRLGLIVVVAVIITLFDLVGSLRQYSEMIHSARLDRVKTAVEAAHSIAASFAARAAKGEMTTEAAQDAAKAAIHDLRYAGNEYVFIVSLDGVVQLQPSNDGLVGKNLLGLKDVNGVAFIAETVKVVREKGEGSVEYRWPKAGSSTPEPKLSFVKGIPEWGWAIGTGVYTDDIAATEQALTLREGARALAELALLVLLAALIGRAIARPLRTLTSEMRRLAGGDHSFEISRDQGAEIGEMQAAVQVFKDNAIEVRRLTEANADSQRQAEAARHALLLSLAEEFERSVNRVVDDVSNAAGQLSTTAESMAAVTDDAARQSDTVAAATEEASANVQTVAAATEELSSSITEISRQVNQSAAISNAAVDAARHTDTIVRGLSEAAQKIGDVVNLINDIAAQTNLLALNATIEAARAGDAGKGFAVVAGEVKHLANQTGRATDEIAQQVSGVQGATREAVDAISGIASTIEEISRIGAAIASAVEQQGAATQEISRNTQQAATGTGIVTQTVGRVASAVSKAGQSAQEVREQAGQLAGDSAVLKQAVARFLEGIRA
ncbi:methyl-accepting chemotaxis protein [Magnetospirillum fulvum]|uniref:Putative methyl-accepting chemotaxis receptor/sensory transducer n=1 Tax=Magnetospirillum fulvum MGU-K5 TaxID=1316936 RepID=S9THJ6_MAGFU|nr:cache domain-containing protein [Magnetospirillum fulvum]EPY01756.1 putative methyl-accepting chemotaxis receptor/sensory transducer [Magnetospirillum fulvum MGU-K5]